MWISSIQFFKISITSCYISQLKLSTEAVDKSVNNCKIIRLKHWKHWAFYHFG